MDFPAVTAGYSAILALIYIALSAWVVQGRGQYRIEHGDGGEARLNRRIRAHANFAEYVPLALIMTAFLEGSGTRPFTIHALLAPLVVSRIMHPIGMVAPARSAQQFIFRAVSAVATWLILFISAFMLIARVM